MKNFFFIALLFASSVVMSQEVKTGKSDPFVPVKYGNDIIIEAAPGIDQENVKLAVAFNGWIYTAFTTVDSANNKGGITIRSSKDNGVTWQTIDSYSFAGIRYPVFDMVVSGTDTNALKLTLVGVNFNIASGENTIYIDNYNATTGSFIGSTYNASKGTRQVYDVAIATDYRYPAVSASPYSLCVAYTVYSTSKDSLNSIVSLDGGLTYTIANNIASTYSYFRKVSLAYGRSWSGSNGRYFAAWELIPSSSARTGNIFTSRNVTQVNGSWTTPVNLDSVSSTMIGLCRNPSIAVQYNDVDNDSASTTAIVLVDRDFNGDGSDYDLLGFYNKRSHYTNYWFRFDISNTGATDIQPDINFDPGYNNFLAVYFDSTNKKLPYCVNSMNLTAPNTWNYISTQYNDDMNLTLPYPKVEINPITLQTAHVWIRDAGTKGVAMLDGEYLLTGLEEQQERGIFSDDQLYPNPATDQVTLQFSMTATTDIAINVFDATGKLTESRTATNRKAGQWMETFDVQNWNNGLYMISVTSGQESFTKRLIVSH